MRIHFQALCLSLLLGLLSSPAFATFSQLYVFGDSLSDTGNVSILTGGAIPGADYYMGRFSNGPNYADDIASRLGLSLAPSLAGGTDYAYGGARTSYHPSGLPLGVLSQVADYDSHYASGDPNALYVVFAGANNLQDALADPANANAIVGQAVTDIGTAINALQAKGAQHFIVPDAPDMGLVPRVLELEPLIPGISGYASLLSAGFNTALNSLLDSYAGLDIRRFDTFGFMHDAVSQPGRFGFSVVDQRCYTGDDLNFTGGGSVCANPDSYLFWDGIHPTAAGHAALASAMYAATIPEPASLALLLPGLLLLVLMRRHHASRALPCPR